ncbi:MAG: response regulator [Chitinophagaceae bacterium]|nr:response regulator [Chitinophagaceae bacterium]
MAGEKINILIVEDESIVAMDLAAGLQMDGYNVVGIADNAEEAEELFKNNPVDIILMDIQIIGDRDGIDTAAALLKTRYVPVIFLTAFTDQKTVERVKQLCPAAFLSKPYSLNNVRISIELALSNFAIAKETQSGAKLISIKEEHTNPAPRDKETILQLNDHIFIKQNYRFIKLKIEDIQYIESANNYINIVATTQKFTLRLQLNEILEKLIFKNIVRIHRSYAVNMSAITSFNDQDITIGKIELPLGKNYKEDFLMRFNMR